MKMVEQPSLQKILVPLDGSQLAERALPYARALAQKFDGRLTLLWVLQPPPLMPVTEFGVLPVHDETLLERAEKQANDYLSGLRDKLEEEGIPADIAITRSPAVAEAIVDFADQGDFDLVVKTTHGRSGISRWVFGSVAAKVLEQAPCPVFLVRIEHEEEDE
ncbi:MAG: universal stress protein [Candidatus Promineifilaceae bacterium]|nr:universal stress protein [Candidatus Promineifilaceae bacterium]